MNNTNRLNEEQFAVLLEACSSEMTNGAVIGYMIMSAQALELPHETIRLIEDMMREKMDFYSAEEAERVYNSFY